MQSLSKISRIISRMISATLPPIETAIGFALLIVSTFTAAQQNNAFH